MLDYQAVQRVPVRSMPVLRSCTGRIPLDNLVGRGGLLGSKSKHPYTLLRSYGWPSISVTGLQTDAHSLTKLSQRKAHETIQGQLIPLATMGY